MKKLLKTLVTFGVAGAMCVTAFGCGGNKQQTQQEKIYATYVAYAQAAGEEVLSYEDWLASIKGAKGDKGDKGDTGATGAAGKDGTNGTNGTDGKSAYRIWLEAGNTGSEQDFLNSLKGAKGDTGATGAAGADGAKGDKGDKGETGATGAQGEKGDQGETGAVGRIGFMVRTAEELNIVSKIDNTYIVLMNDITFNDEVVVIGADVVLDLGGHTINGIVRVAGENAYAVVKNGKVNSASGDGLRVYNGATLVVDDLDVIARECSLGVDSKGTLIVNSGTYTSTDNLVIMTNGSKDKGNNKITVNGGTFNGNIKSAGYIAGGVYVANDDEVTVNGGTFNIVNGVGILARSGKTTVKAGVEFNITSTEGGIAAGWVGDNKIIVPTGKAIVLDTISGYPGGAPTVTAEGYDVFTLEKTSVDSAESLASALENSTYVVLGGDIEVSDKIVVAKSLILDLGGHTITGTDAIRVAGKDAYVTVKNGNMVDAAGALGVYGGATLVAEGLNVKSVECCFAVNSNGTLVVNSGTYTSTDNLVIMTNGSEGLGNNKITVNGGTFNGSITSAGYIAGGIYVANNDEVTVNAGTFNIENGIGIMARSGKTTVKAGVKFNITSTEGGIAAGWVGDKKVQIPTGKEIVLDLVSDYPGGAPTVTADGHEVFTFTEA